MTHTPGPWNVQEGLHNNRYCEIWSGPLCIGETSGCGEIRSEGEDAANARLIAAAPELLASCMDARYELAVLVNQFGLGFDTPTEHPVIVRLDAAISRATGEDAA